MARTLYINIINDALLKVTKFEFNDTTKLRYILYIYIYINIKITKESIKYLCY